MAKRKRFSVHDLYPEDYCFDYEAFEKDPENYKFTAEEPEKYVQLQKEYNDALGYLGSYSQYVRRQAELIRCQHDYIHWKALDDEFALFQKYAHGEDSDTDFSYLVM